MKWLFCMRYLKEKCVTSFIFFTKPTVCSGSNCFILMSFYKFQAKSNAQTIIILWYIIYHEWRNEILFIETFSHSLEMLLPIWSTTLHLSFWHITVSLWYIVDLKKKKIFMQVNCQIVISEILVAQMILQSSRWTVLKRHLVTKMRHFYHSGPIFWMSYGIVFTL